MSKSRVIVKDRGFAAIVQNTKSLKGHVVVGVPSSKRSDGEDNADVAIGNEYGTERSPARPFLRPAVDERIPQLFERKRELAIQVQDGAITPTEALSELGEALTEAVQQKILDTYDPPNAQSTIDRKGSDHPLLDTEQMFDAVTHAVHLGEARRR